MRTEGSIDPAVIVERAGRLGFHERDLDDLRVFLDELPAGGGWRTELAGYLDRLRAGIGRLAVDGPDPWADRSDARDDGRLSVLALLVVAPEAVAFQVGRGVPEGEAWRNLSDLGQQVWVHRLVYGRFGLHNQDWLRIVWAGGFAWLGRLQFNLQWLPGDEWVLSTHIPRRSPEGSGALTPAAVDDSFAWAARFYADHFSDLPTTDFWCHSWLLAPELAAALPGSNIAAFQQRWALDEHVQDGDDDAVYFTFARQAPYQVDRLPQTTSLERAVVARLGRGLHWTLRRGRIPRADFSGDQPLR
ncbi:MAG: acyltransferase domain-containing protein [Micropruina sp.]|uniref:acyltransferase domain-containing protein n=1 Tax=Micropruina sp. TaxID=2737536 RepID=UPI0039E3ADA3